LYVSRDRHLSPDHEQIAGFDPRTCGLSPAKEAGLSQAAHKGGHGKCITCLHKDRAAIEDAVSGGMPIAKAAKQFGGLSASALQRHMDRHARSTALVRVQPSEIIIATQAGDSTASELEALLITARTQLETAGSVTQALAAIDAVLKIVVARGAWQERVAARQPSPTINLLTTPSYRKLRGIVFDQLTAHDLKHHAGGYDEASGGVRIPFANELDRLEKEMRHE
jgi:hypothetical protein